MATIFRYIDRQKYIIITLILVALSYLQITQVDEAN